MLPRLPDHFSGVLLHRQTAPNPVTGSRIAWEPEALAINPGLKIGTRKRRAESVLRDVAQIIWPLTGVATLPPVRSHKRLLVLLRIAGLVCRRKEAKPDRLGDEAGFATGLQLAAQGFQMKPDRGL